MAKIRQKLTDHTFAYISLTNFDYKVNTGNGNTDFVLKNYTSGGF